MSSNLFWDLQQALKLGLAVTTDVWNYPIGDWVSSVHAADINGDGDMEVLLASRNCNIYVLTKRGTLEGKYRPSNGWVRAIRGNDDAGTTDKTPIVVGSRDNKVQVLNKNGEVLWSYQTNGEVCDIRICDMNHDGKSEILVACEDSCIHALSGETGEVFWKYDTLSTVYTVDVNDIDLDGEIEILATASDMQLYVLDSRGQLKWKYDTKSESALIFAADIDGDGQVEILLASNTRGLSALTPLRQEKWHFPFDKRFLSITVADLDKDGQLEIIAATEDKRLYFFDNQGQLLWIHTLNNQVFSLCAADLDHDGAVEVLIGTEDSIHVLHVDLMRGLRENILASHKLLGKPQSTKLALSSTEIALLRDITNEWSLDKQLLTLANAKQYRQSGDTLQALSMLTLLRQQRVQVLWHREIGHVRAIYAGDVNDDGRLEIVAGTDEGAICVFDADGGKRWSNPYDGCVWTVYVGDIDLDGAFEIVAGSASGLLSVFNQAGEVKWQSYLGGQIESVYIYEMQGLGYAEMVVGLRGNQGGQIQIYDHHFSSVIEPITTPYGIKVVGLHDLNDDGMADIVAVGDDDSVYAYTRDGNLLWSYRIGDRAGDLARGLSLRDIDADGGIEIVVGSEDRNVHILDRAGHLKWCYYTPNRVLSVNTRDVDQDGAVEVFLGTDDGYVYFLSKTGDLLWKYRVGSRVRGVQADDVNKDGNIEIVVGSEDRILYVLQMVNQQQIAEEIEGCWQALQYNAGDQQGLLYELAYSSISSLRCFALMRIASQPAYKEKDLEILQELVGDPSNDVRFTFAQEIAQIHRVSPSHSRSFLDLLLADQERDVRLALVDSLTALTRIDGHSGFQYLERLTRSVDSWVRRAVVRKLYQLVDAFPHQVFRLLLSLVCDETEWVRQEAARALAHYFDLHEETVIEESRFLITHNVDFPLLLSIAYCATRPSVQSIFLVAHGLLVDLNETNVQERLEKALMVFRKTRKLKHGEVTWQVYRELHRLHRMRTIDEISSYTCTVCQEDLSDITQFEGIVQTLRQLAAIAAILGTYLKRDGLGDRLASLLEASSALESIRLNLEREPLAEKGQKPKLPDHLLVELLLTRWRDIVVIELKGLRGKANLKPELRTKSTYSEQHVGIWLEIRNEGRSPADNLKVMLKESSDFEIISEPIRELEIVPASGMVIAEFTIHPKTPVPHLTFEIIYDDAEFKEKLLLFGDKLQIRENDREFKRMVNPYTVGVPIQKPEMFYGREKDLEMLQEDLTSTSANMVVVLCGQRRSGKSSLLYQLRNSGCLSPHVCVYIDMQHETYGLSTSKLFYHLAFAIYRDLKAVGLPTDLPSAEDFAHDPTFAFDQFLDDAEEARGQRKLIIMIDEFEILELKVSEKILDWEIFEYLRSLMQHRRGINFLFSGTHSIEQLTQGYWSVFFNIARHHRLSNLHENASRQLITQPVKGYLEYDPLAIEKIRLLAADQPYLIQLFCRSLVTHCNRSRKSYITINDVNTVQDEVMETGQIHFRWLWEQATLEERLVLSIVAQEGREEGRALSLKKIKEVYQIHGLLYHHETILHAIESLIEADIVERVAEGTHFRVPIGLIRKWLLEVKPLRRVLQEENFPIR